MNGTVTLTEALADALGRAVEVKLPDGSTVTGRLIEVSRRENGAGLPPDLTIALDDPSAP